MTTPDIEAIRRRFENHRMGIDFDAATDILALLAALDATTAERVCDAFEHKRKLDEAWEFCGGVVKERDTLKARVEELEAVLAETVTEIEYWHSDMLTEDERSHPRGSGWARVWDKAQAALGQPKE